MKKPEDYRTAKFTIYIYRRDENTKNNFKMKGAVQCTSTGKEIRFNSMGEMLDYITKSLVDVEKRYQRIKKKIKGKYI